MAFGFGFFLLCNLRRFGSRFFVALLLRSGFLLFFSFLLSLGFLFRLSFCFGLCFSNAFTAGRTGLCPLFGFLRELFFLRARLLLSDFGKT